MRSMTGYGEAVGECGRLQVAVRARGVNHRFLDLALRLPDELRSCEGALRELVAERVGRGRLELTAEVRWLAERPASVEIHRGVLRELKSACDDLAAEGLIAAELRLGELLRLPEAVSVRFAPLAGDAAARELLLAVTGRALEALVAEREREGKRLAGALEQRLAELAVLVARLAERRGEVERSLRERIGERLRALTAEVGMPEERLLQEVALAVDRTDVAEELERLDAHLAGFRAGLGEGAPVGKRLDFLAQEIFRELNTLASKCRDTGLAAWAVDGKLLCEQLREQVQNVE